MSRSCRLLVIAFWAVVTPTGCSVLHYPVDRAKDLVDVVGFDLYWGQGVIAHAQATKMVQLGVGSFDGNILKIHNRAIGVVEEIRSEAGLPFYYFTVYDRKAVAGNDKFLKRHREITGLGEVQYNLADPQDRGFYAVGANLALFIGAGVDVDLFQALDFMTGWLFFDLGRDDYRNRDREPVENPRYKGTGDRPISGDLTLRATY